MSAAVPIVQLGAPKVKEDQTQDQTQDSYICQNANYGTLAEVCGHLFGTLPSSSIFEAKRADTETRASLSFLLCPGPVQRERKIPLDPKLIGCATRSLLHLNCWFGPVFLSPFFAYCLRT